MKKVLSLALVLTLLVLTLASCGNTLSGTYEYSVTVLSVTTTISMTFDGENVTIKNTVAGISTETTGTYVLDKDAGTIAITYTDDEGNGGTKTVDFSEGEENGVKFIKIDGTQYNKVDK